MTAAVSQGHTPGFDLLGRALRRYAIFIILAALIVFFHFAEPAFLRVNNLFSVLPPHGSQLQPKRRSNEPRPLARRSRRRVSGQRGESFDDGEHEYETGFDGRERMARRP